MTTKDCAHDPFPATVVDYGAVASFKSRLVETAWKRFEDGAGRELPEPYERFCHEQNPWLDDYAVFRALKTKFRDVGRKRIRARFGLDFGLEMLEISHSFV